MAEDKFYAVYRQLQNGKLLYVPRSMTSNEKLAKEIALDLSAGQIVMPDGSTRRVTAYPHIHKEV